MKNHLYILLIILSVCTYCIGQNSNTELPLSINDDGAAPHSTAILDIQSNSKGVLIPRMTTSLRESVSNPADGLLVFDLTTGSFWFYVGQGWTELGGSSNTPAWNDISGIPSDIADGDDIDDADNDPNNELQNWANLPGIPTEISDGDDINDADNDPTNEIELPSGGTSGQILVIDDTGNASWQSQGNSPTNLVLNIPGSGFLPENLEANTGEYSLNMDGRSGSLPLIYPLNLNVGIHVDSLQFFFNPFFGSFTIEVIQQNIISGDEEIIASQTPLSALVSQISPTIIIDHTILENRIYRIKFSQNQIGIGPPRIRATTVFYKG